VADAQALLQLQSFVDEALQGRTDLRVLDAGCGSSSYVRLPETAHRVGIDISAEQLRKNTFVHEKILGDIQEYELPSASFDVIICWWVLEHLREPTKVLSRFRDALRENGIIILAVPNVISIKGLVTKLTPFWFHVWIYRTLHGDKMAGAPGRPPFRTWLRFAISPGAISRFAHKSALSVDYINLFEDEGIERLRRRHGMVNVCWSLPRVSVRVATFGKIDLGLTECIVVLNKAAVARGASDSRAVDAPHLRAVACAPPLPSSDQWLSSSVEETGAQGRDTTPLDSDARPRCFGGMLEPTPESRT
jgi:SAM-dependent methyltransferase